MTDEVIAEYIRTQDIEERQKKGGGFLTAVALICDDSAKQKIEGAFGDSLYSDEEFTLWDAKRIAVLFAKNK